ncbi:MAG TPA: Nif11-like leader peptide family natural product precursor [Thermoanaerobaculia bacterium]|nr:Nif11-like leader peptide family natural product precursor [Thermoanaerobaculia bacterium]
MSKQTALEFLRKAESNPELRPQLEAVGPYETARFLVSLSAIAVQAGYQVTARDLQEAMREWAAEMLSESELSRLA